MSNENKQSRQELEHLLREWSTEAREAEINKRLGTEEPILDLKDIIDKGEVILNANQQAELLKEVKPRAKKKSKKKAKAKKSLGVIDEGKK